MTKPNERQVAGKHYGGGNYQHWDFVVDNDLNYFEGQITKYVMRCRKKNGLEDLEKAKHFLEKYIEQYSRLNRLPAEVVRVLPRSQANMDQEYADQEAAKAYFQPDGFSGDGTNGYQCIRCRQVVRANSPLGALKLHPSGCCTTPGQLGALTGAGQVLEVPTMGHGTTAGLGG